MNINWFPGHMKKAGDMIKNDLRLVDVVIEIIDARIPESAMNPWLRNIIRDKKRIIVLNKSDLADAEQTELWIKKLECEGYVAVPMNAETGEGIKILKQKLQRINDEINTEKKRNKKIRVMIVGIPNVGKSSLINRLSKKKSTATGNIPGVTKGKQWITLSDGIMLLDTPGILWPKIEKPETGRNLAICGSIKNEVLDDELLSKELLLILKEGYGNLLLSRYKLKEIPNGVDELFELIGKKRGLLQSGGRVDVQRTSRVILSDMREAKLGRITLEKANDCYKP